MFQILILFGRTRFDTLIRRVGKAKQKNMQTEPIRLAHPRCGRWKQASPGTCRNLLID